MQRAVLGDAWLMLAAAAPVPHALRPALLRRAGITVGTDTLVRSGLRLVRGAPVRIGARSFLNHDCYLDARAPVDIGDDVLIGDHVRLVTSTHEPGTPERRAGTPTGRPVVVEDGVWIGTGATILPGVRVGRGCVVAAGAVVTRDCAPDGLYAGVPATRRRDL